MAVRKIPAFPSGIARGVWANKLADAAIYAVESDAINYNDGTAVSLFSIPEEFILLGLGLEVVTAWADPGGNPSLVVQDAVGDLAVFGPRVLRNVGFYEYPVLRRYAKTAGVGIRTRLLQVDVNDPGTATAGIARVWLKFKPNRAESLRVDYT